MWCFCMYVCVVVVVVVTRHSLIACTASVTTQLLAAVAILMYVVYTNIIPMKFRDYARCWLAPQESNRERKRKKAIIAAINKSEEIIRGDLVMVLFGALLPSLCHAMPIQTKQQRSK